MAWNVVPDREEIGFLMETSLIYRDSGKFNQAREILAGLRAMLPRNDAVLVTLGTVCFQQRDFDAAARYYKQALELNPRSAYACAHLGELEMFRMNKEQATAHLKTAIQLDPRGPYGSFARALLDLGAEVKYKDRV
jgi:tetratricopeptide (TPR) repeat protein